MPLGSPAFSRKRDTLVKGWVDRPMSGAVLLLVPVIYRFRARSRGLALPRTRTLSETYCSEIGMLETYWMGLISCSGSRW